MTNGGGGSTIVCDWSMYFYEVTVLVLYSYKSFFWYKIIVGSPYDRVSCNEKSRVRTLDFMNPWFFNRKIKGTYPRHDQGCNTEYLSGDYKHFLCLARQMIHTNEQSKKSLFNDVFTKIFWVLECCENFSQR